MTKEKIDGFFKYEVEYFDELTNKICVAKGLTYADSWRAAAASLEKYYNIMTIHDLYRLGTVSYYNIDENKNVIQLFLK